MHYEIFKNQFLISGKYKYTEILFLLHLEEFGALGQPCTLSQWPWKIRQAASQENLMTEHQEHENPSQRTLCTS